MDKTILNKLTKSLKQNGPEAKRTQQELTAMTVKTQATGNN